MERLENQNGPEITVLPKAGYTSLLGRLEQRYDNPITRTALALGALFVAQVGTLELQSTHHEQAIVHVEPVQLHSKSTVVHKPVIKKPKIVHFRASPLTKTHHSAHIIHNNMPTPDAASNNLAPYIKLIPSLDQDALLFPASFPRAQEEKAYIRELASKVNVTPNGFKQFALDTSRRDAFQSFPYSQVKNANEQSYVFHWTAEHYAYGVDQLVHNMLTRHTIGLNGENIPDRVSVYNFTPHDGKVVYQLLPNDHYRAAHARGLNYFTQGIEMEAANIAPNRPASEVMFDITPEEVDAALYAAVLFCVQNGLPVNETSLISHYEVDLLYNNSAYNPSKGTFKPHATLGKFDLPKEFMTEVVLPKARPLYRQLIKRGLVKTHR